MMGRLLLGYAVVELMVLVGLAATIGFGWTALVLLGTFLLGVTVLAPLGGLQLARRLLRLRSGAPRSALGDGFLISVASVLVLVPGVATTALGLLLLVPPVRAVACTGLAAAATRGLLGHAPSAADVPVGGDGRDYIDGEVIDVHDVAPPSLPSATIGDEASARRQ
ncbi:FxsA family protein [Mycobacterium shinjukuense]|uniref:Membrane protein FxsA n=1 Tax=Mycobacterium shinjukuense TaxID=398694 RepID=A0A7I7MLZ9_9MYCO|nr:FxsA family protein [Mycobacterium shinjukuense]MCV6984808.1 FxsA family protein [Mycobacterium shinjukuense]ORB69465.1 membrane protein FxsA [Mycobacterium shinjukuense]BBX73294.1 membrane protein FxsA [Mycobacterium shinjukuense]